MVDLDGIRNAYNGIFGLYVEGTWETDPDWLIVKNLPTYPAPYTGWSMSATDRALVHRSLVIAGDDKRVFSYYYAWPLTLDDGVIKASYMWLAGFPLDSESGPTAHGFNNLREFVVSLPNRHGYTVGVHKFYTSYGKHLTFNDGKRIHYIAPLYPHLNQYRLLFGNKPAHALPVVIGRKYS